MAPTMSLSTDSQHTDYATGAIFKQGNPYLGNPFKQHDHFSTKIHSDQK